MSTLGITVARKGSRRLPGKNKKVIAGKPLIAWTIESALQSKLLTNFAVSTDDLDIKDIAKGYGVRVIDMPPFLACDRNQSELNMCNVMDHFSIHEYVCLLQCTSPIRHAGTIDDTIRLMQGQLIGSVISKSLSTQKYNGNIYISEWEEFYRTARFPEPIHFIYQDDEESIDIDLFEDFIKAERILSGNLV